MAAVDFKKKNNMFQNSIDRTARLISPDGRNEAIEETEAATSDSFSPKGATTAESIDPTNEYFLLSNNKMKEEVSDKDNSFIKRVQRDLK